MLERMWRQRGTGQTYTGDAPPPGPGWYLLGADGEESEEGRTGLAMRGVVGFRSGPFVPAQRRPAPPAPYDPLHYGLDGGKVLRKGLR